MPQPSGDARRTSLANERTQLAWWRTGLTAVAVALAVGRVVPQLNHTGTKWPYVVVGAGFAIYAIALIGYGNIRSREVDEAAERGEFAPPPHAMLTALGLVGMALCLFTMLLVIFD